MANSTIKYSKPKILLIDFYAEVADKLEVEGFNVSSGTFGTPYIVTVSDNYAPVKAHFDLPNYQEQEIFIIDLVPFEAVPKPIGEKWTSDGEVDWWIKCSKGIIDPRPRIMDSVRSKFNELLSYNHIFVIFADSKEIQTINLAHIPYSALTTVKKLTVSNWRFLPIFEASDKIPYQKELHIENVFGSEMFPAKVNSPLVNLLSRYLDDGEYKCAFSVYHGFENLTGYKFEPLAINKFGKVISCKLSSPKEDGGTIYIFPQIENKADFLSKLLIETLPADNPKLFPFFEGNLWLNQPTYQLPTVLKLSKEIIRIEEEAKQQIEEINKQIQEEKDSNKFLTDLLTETGDPLVRAVKECLEKIGFTNVIDADEEREKTGDTSPKREDLRIEDQSPLILVEIKGITNLPKESHSLQVWKYIIPKIRKLDRNDIRGLSIINHQKGLPPLARENIHTFGEDILANAEDQNFGLLTTWDLYRLMRSFIKNGWKFENVKDLFYKNGRIAPVPTHYEYIGKTDEFYEKVEVIGIHIEYGSISLDDYIAFDLPVEFKEERICSLQLDNVNITTAREGQYVGIKTTLNKSQARKNINVYKIKG